MQDLSQRLLYQCEGCSHVYTKPREECGLCGGTVKPVRRIYVLRRVHRRMIGARVIEEKVTSGVHAKTV